MADLKISKEQLEQMKCYLTREIEYYNRDARDYLRSIDPKDILAAEKDLEIIDMLKNLNKLVLKYEGEIEDGKKDNK